MTLWGAGCAHRTDAERSVNIWARDSQDGAVRHHSSRRRCFSRQGGHDDTITRCIRQVIRYRSAAAPGAPSCCSIPLPEYVVTSTHVRRRAKSRIAPCPGRALLVRLAPLPRLSRIAHGLAGCPLALNNDSFPTALGASRRIPRSSATGRPNQHLASLRRCDRFSIASSF